MGARERWRLQALTIAIICILLFFAMRPYFLNIVEVRDLQNCETNMRKISRGISLYMKDWDGAYPPGPYWMNCIERYMDVTSNTGFKLSDYFHCPHNDILAGIVPGEVARDPEKEAVRLKLRNARNFPLVIEKHGSVENAHVTMWDWDSLSRALTMSHKTPALTGVIVTGSGSVERKSADQLKELTGRKF